MILDLLTYHQTSELLGVPIGTLYALVSRQQIPHFRMGRRIVRFSKREIEDWVIKHQVIPMCGFIPGER